MSTAELTVESSLLVIESDPFQTRAAVLENGRLAEIYIERRDHAGVVGNVYKGRVSRVLPGMQAAFVDVGLTRDAFLYAGDIRGSQPALDDMADDQVEGGDATARELRPIEELLSQGEDVLVQVVKAPLANKGARVTTGITLPGRHTVLVPTVPSSGISRRIQDPVERERLQGILEELLDGEDGLIIRTAGEGGTREEFEADVAALKRTWKEIGRRARTARPPTLVHQEHDLALRLVRDRFGEDFDGLIIRPGETHERIRELFRQTDPQLIDKIRLFEEQGLPFDRFGVEKELHRALKSRVWLKSGGYVVINPTEALVSIDVNTGRFVGRNDFEETILRTNQEAAVVIARQIRLRDLSGIIVIDFIDMAGEADRARVLELLRHELERDRARNQVLDFTEFGLVQITRRRARSNLQRLLTAACPCCDGSGRVLSVSTVCLKLRREALRRDRPAKGKRLRVRVHPEVEQALRGEWAGMIEELAARLATSVDLEPSAELHRGVFELTEV